MFRVASSLMSLIAKMVICPVALKKCPRWRWAGAVLHKDHMAPSSSWLENLLSSIHDMDLALGTWEGFRKREKSKYNKTLKTCASH